MLRPTCFAVSLLVLAACGDDTAPAGGGGGAPIAGSNAGGGGSDGGNGGASSGGGPVGGGGGGNGGTGEGGSPIICDGDGDTLPLMGAGCCGAPDTCDCDDNDSNVFPEQEMFFTEPRPFEDDPILMWDYNCDGLAQKQYEQAAGNCGALACGVDDTIEFLGLNDDYFCGAPGTLVICSNAGLSCEVQGGATLACR